MSILFYKYYYFLNFTQNIKHYVRSVFVYNVHFNLYHITTTNKGIQT